MDQRQSPITFAGYIFDARVGRLIGPQGEIRLRPKTFEALAVLLEASPAVVSRDDLVWRVWEGRAVSDTVVAQAISEIRHALGDTARDPTYIETVHRRGYRFMHPVAHPERDVTPPRRSPPSAAAPTHSAAASGRRGLVVTLFFALCAVALWGLLETTDRGREIHSPPSRPSEPSPPPPLRLALVPVPSESADPSRRSDVLLAMIGDRLQPHLEPGLQGKLAGGGALLRGDRVVRMRHDLNPREAIGQRPIADYLGASHLFLGQMTSSPTGAATSFKGELWQVDGDRVLLSLDIPFSDRPASVDNAVRLATTGLSITLDWPMMPRRPAVDVDTISCWRLWILGLEAEVDGDPDSALRHFREAFQHCPSADLQYEVARIQAILGQDSVAAPSARAAARSRGPQRWRRQLLARRLAGDTLGALQTARHHLQRYPHHGAARLEVAQVALRLPPQDALPLAVLRQHLDHPSLTYDPAWMVERDLLLARIDTAEGRPAAAHRRLEEAHRRSLDLGLHHAAGRIQAVLDARSANLNPKEQPLR